MSRPLINLTLILLLAAVTAASPLSRAEQDENPKDSEVKEKTDDKVLPGTKLEKPITYDYVENGHEKQVLDFYRYLGKRQTLRPVLIWFHGGGWVKGSREWIDPIAFEIATLGKYNLVSADYRLAGDKNAPWPLIVHDIKAVVRWVRINANMLRVNGDKIIVGGESAGAHLAAMAALSQGEPDLEGPENTGVSSRVSAAVLFYGAYNMKTLAEKKQKSITKGRCPKPSYSSPVLYLLDCPNVDPTTYNIDGCDDEKVKQADPGTYLDATDPPVFIAHGEDDCIVPWSQAREFVKKLDEAGVTHRFESSEDGEHRVWTLDVSAQDVVKFLDKHMAE